MANGVTPPGGGSFLTDLFNPIVSQVSSGIQSSLPTREELQTQYLKAITAFWVIGGVTLFLVAILTRPRK